MQLEVWENDISVRIQWNNSSATRPRASPWSFLECNRQFWDILSQLISHELRRRAFRTTQASKHPSGGCRGDVFKVALSSRTTLKDSVRVIRTIGARRSHVLCFVKGLTADTCSRIYTYLFILYASTLYVSPIRIREPVRRGFRINPRM